MPPWDILFTHLVRALEQSRHTKCRSVLHIIFLGKAIRLTKPETLYSTQKKPYYCFKLNQNPFNLNINLTAQLQTMI